MKQRLCLQTRLVVKNYTPGFPCWWERPWLSQEHGVDILKQQPEENLSVLQAITISGSGQEPHIACKLIFLLEVTLHKLSQSQGLLF